jgi:hypothetical protein
VLKFWVQRKKQNKMPKVNYLTMRFYSRKSLDTKRAEALLSFLDTYSKGKLMPEKYDLSEPLKKGYSHANKVELIEWLSRRGGNVQLKRVKQIRYDLLISDNAQKNINLDGTLFSSIIQTELIFWIDNNIIQSQSAKGLKTLLIRLSFILESDFSFITSMKDFDSKNHLEIDLGNTSIEAYIGETIEKTGIPGLYWINVFGKEYVNWFGKEKFKKIDCSIQELKKGYILLQYCEEPSECQKKSTLIKQQKTKEILGEHAFFNLSKLKEKAKKNLHKNIITDINKFAENAKVPKFLQLK